MPRKKFRSEKRTRTWTGGQYTPKLPRLLPTTIISLAFLLLLTIILTLGVAWLSGVRILPLSHGIVTGDQLYNLVRTTVTAGTLFAGVFAIVYAYRKQRIDEAGSMRADAEQLSKRYQDAALQLGHERAAVRLAGIYTIGRLADDWTDNRQMCVDLLCAYMRMPYTLGKTADDEHIVRSTVLDVVREHVKDPTSPTNWCDLRFDFSGGTYDNVPLYDCHFHNSVSFADATFTGIARREDDKNYGWIRFNHTTFSGNVSFFQAKFHECIVMFDEAEFSASSVHFGGASFVDFNLFFRKAKFTGSEIRFWGTTFLRNKEKLHNSLGNIRFDNSIIDGSEVNFDASKVVGPLDMSFKQIKLISGKLQLSKIDVRQGGSDKDSPMVTIEPAEVAEDTLEPPPPARSTATAPPSLPPT